MKRKKKKVFSATRTLSHLYLGHAWIKYKKPNAHHNMARTRDTANLMSFRIFIVFFYIHMSCRIFMILLKIFGFKIFFMFEFKIFMSFFMLVLIGWGQNGLGWAGHWRFTWLLFIMQISCAMAILKLLAIDSPDSAQQSIHTSYLAFLYPFSYICTTIVFYVPIVVATVNARVFQLQ